jgi:hypothetical protein
VFIIKFLAQCTQSKDHQKVVTRHNWQEYVKEADHLRHHKDVKPIYAKRKDVDAGDANFRCHEFEEDGQLDLERSGTGIR